MRTTPLLKLFSAAVLSAVCGGCSVMKEKQPDPALDFVKRPLTQEDNEKLASEVGSNWLYGQGFGETATAIGGIVLFPPYAIYVLGNGALSLSGYEPLYVTNLLPDQTRSGYNAVYDGVTSGPGRLSAALAGEEYRTQTVIRERYKNLLEARDGPGRTSDQAEGATDRRADQRAE